jgi:predicted nuclease of predicted toxin-antitoxin system
LKFKIDENLSPALAGAFAVAGHEAHTILEQSLGGKSDAAIIEVCARKGRALVLIESGKRYFLRDSDHYPYT